MKEKKKPYGTGKVVFLSFLCVLLTIVLGAGLLLCVTANQLLRDESRPKIGEAASQIPLEQVTLPDGRSLGAAINQSYIGSPLISDSQMEQILRDGSFNKWVGKKAQSYVDYIAQRGSGDAVLPEITPEEMVQLLDDNDDTIRLHTGFPGFAKSQPVIEDALSRDLTTWNTRVRSTIGDGMTATLIGIAVSMWGWIILGGLLLLILIWLIVIHVRGRRHVGTAFKTFAVAALIPSAAVCAFGAFGGKLLDLAGLGLYTKAFGTLHETPLTVGGIGALGCIALLGFGILWNAIAHKPDTAMEVPAYDPAESAVPKVPEEITPAEPTPIPEPIVTPPEPITTPPEPITKPIEPELPAPEEPVVIRHYCRFCGGELVNSDAKFCYKCGKPQEPAE